MDKTNGEFTETFSKITDNYVKLISKNENYSEIDLKSILLNILNCISYLLTHKNFVIEQLNNSETDRTDLTYMMNAAIKSH